MPIISTFCLTGSGTNECSDDNGSCVHFCLPIPQGKRVCRCAESRRSECAPAIKTGPYDMIVSRSQRVSIVCEVGTKGFDVKVEIIRDGNVVRIEHVPSVAHLPLRTVRYTIPSISQNDTGAYSCRASNEYGNDTSKESILTMGSCIPFVTGSRCNNTNPCDVQVNPCQNGGTCRTGVTGVTCECVLDYTGALCTTYIPSQTQTHTPDSNRITIIVSVVVVVVIVIIVLVVVVVVLRRRRRKTFQASASYNIPNITTVRTVNIAHFNDKEHCSETEDKQLPGNPQSTV